MAAKHKYLVENLGKFQYPAEELTTYLNEMSSLQQLKLISVYTSSTGELTLVWELE